MGWFENAEKKIFLMVLMFLDSVAFASMEELAKAPWIGDGCPARDGAEWYAEDPAPEFRAEFVLPAGAAEAKVRFACAGFGWFHLGDRALMSADGLDTLWSVYDRTVYGVTKAVKVGDAFGLKPCPAKNEVRVFLGNGFYNLPPLLFWGSRSFRKAVAHGRPCFKLVIDGVEKPLEWTWRKTNVIRNSVYLGTEIDATRPENADWQPARNVKGPAGEIVEWPQTNPQMKCFDIHHGTSTWLKAGEVQVVDFGVNASGVPDFTFAGEERGTHIEIVYGERLNADGSVNVLTQTAGQIKKPGKGGPGAPDVACQRDAYVCRGTDDRFRPPFTWHIFRYAEIRGAKRLLGPHQSLSNVRSMLSMRTDVGAAPLAKAFKTDDADLQRIHEMCRRTFQANLIGGVQSDCPGRERLGYGGDIVATYEAMIANFDMREIYLKVLRDFADEAAGDGWITETAPYVGIAVGGWGGRSGPISWTLAVPALIDAFVRHYPDVADRALAFYPTCARYMRLVDEKCPDGIVPLCIGDHEALERAPNEVTATAHWYEFARLTAKIARRLGREDDAQAFAAIADKVKRAFQAKFVKDGMVANGSQSAQAIGLYLGLVPADQIAAAEERLVKALEAKDFGPTTGIFSTRYMLMYLAEHGKNDLARKIVLHRGFPGWLHMLDRGATTLWETWKESDDIYSNCHPMFGSVDEWILKYGSGVSRVQAHP